MLEIIRSAVRGQPNCRICGKRMDAHSLEEDLICGLREQREREISRCPVCDRIVAMHSYEEMHACAVKDRDQRGKG